MDGRGYGRWVGNDLVWTKGPFLFRNELVVAELGPGATRAALPGEESALGEPPLMVRVAEGGQIEIAAAEDERRLVLGLVASEASGVKAHGDAERDRATTLLES